MHTKDTIMPELENLRVHIAPIGFEIDRVVIPARKLKADKVCLLVHDNPSQDKAITFADKIQTQLKRSKIKFQIITADRLNLFSIINSVREIIEQEKENNVYVNVASGSKIQAIGCMMACMIFKDRQNIKPFYAEAEEYAGFKGRQQSFGVKEMQSLPTFEIHTPKPELIHTLNIIKEKGGKITKKELADIAEKEKLITVNAQKKNYSQVLFTSLDKNIIQPLKDEWNFVDVEKIGRNRHVKITQDGLNATEFLI